MIYSWFKIFNLSDFDTTTLVSKTYTLELQDIGEKTILVTKGKLLSITYEGVMLATDLLPDNPFYQDDLGVFLDDNGDVYLGIGKNEN